MTLIEHSLPATVMPLANHAFEVRWDSLRLGGWSNGHEPLMTPSTFVLQIELLCPERALLEAWVESPSGRHAVIDRHSARIVLNQDGSFLHVDAWTEDESRPVRLAAVSIAQQDGGAQALMYVCTPLLERAGFAAGSLGRPTVSDPGRRFALPRLGSQIYAITPSGSPAHPPSP